jgi:hypothetical protein
MQFEAVLVRDELALLAEHFDLVRRLAIALVAPVHEQRARAAVAIRERARDDVLDVVREHLRQPRADDLVGRTEEEIHEVDRMRGHLEDCAAAALARRAPAALLRLADHRAAVHLAAIADRFADEARGDEFLRLAEHLVVAVDVTHLVDEPRGVEQSGELAAFAGGEAERLLDEHVEPLAMRGAENAAIQERRRAHEQRIELLVLDELLVVLVRAHAEIFLEQRVDHRGRVGDGHDVDRRVRVEDGVMGDAHAAGADDAELYPGIIHARTS